MDKKNTKLLIAVIEIIVFLAVIFGFVYSIYYSIPVGDDFSMGMDVEGKNLFLAAVSRANYYYINWGGQWPFFFIQTLCNPLNLISGNAHAPGIVLLVFFALFLIVLFALIKTFFKEIVGNEDFTIYMGVFVAILAAVLNGGLYFDVLYFFVGNCYLQAATCIMLTMIFVIKFMKNNKVSSGVLASVTGFISCIFYAQSIMPLLVMLALIIYDTYWEKKFRIKVAYPFFFMLVGACVGAFAPGNFVRKSQSHNAQINIVVAVKDTIMNLVRVYRDLLLDPIFIIAIVVLVIIGAVSCKYILEDIKLGYVVAMLVVSVMITLVGAFPVALGYGDYALPMRVTFYLKLYAILGLSATAIIAGGYLNKTDILNLDEPKSKFISIVAIVAFGYSILTPLDNFYSQPIMYTYIHHVDAKKSAAAWMDIYHQIEASEDKDVVIEAEPIDNYLILGADFETDWGREQIADYFGKDSVEVIWIEQESQEN